MQPLAGNHCLHGALEFENWKGFDMKKAVLALATAATIGVTALVTPSPAQAWRGGWGGWGAGLAGGLIAGAVIGGIASSAYAYGQSKSERIGLEGVMSFGWSGTGPFPSV
jgi:hypothetical protein